MIDWGMSVKSSLRQEASFVHLGYDGDFCLETATEETQVLQLSFVYIWN